MYHKDAGTIIHKYFVGTTIPCHDLWINSRDTLPLLIPLASKYREEMCYFFCQQRTCLLFVLFIFSVVNIVQQIHLYIVCTYCDAIILYSNMAYVIQQIIQNLLKKKNILCQVKWLTIFFLNFLSYYQLIQNDKDMFLGLTCVKIFKFSLRSCKKNH